MCDMILALHIMPINILLYVAPLVEVTLEAEVALGTNLIGMLFFAQSTGRCLPHRNTAAHAQTSG